jgi:glycosyltransferase involved in cell wall biosynthesis
MSRFNVGGTAQWLYQLSDGLSKNSVENLLIVGDCTLNEIEDDRLKMINHKQIKGLGPGSNLLSSLKALLKLRDEMKKFNPDIVNTHTSKAGALGRIAAWTITPRPKIFHTFHGHVFHGYFNPFVTMAITIFERMLSKITDYFFVLGKQVLTDLRNTNIISKDNFFEILPGVEDPVRIDIGKAREELGLKPDSFVIGWLGRKVAIKRIDRILDLAELNPNLVFLLAGVGDSIKSTYSQRFIGEKLKNVVEVGYRTPSQIWSASDACLITSDNEGIPTSSIEAALFSLPVVSTQAGSIRDVVEDGVTGYICDSDIASLSIAIRRLSQDPELAKEMGRKARQQALTKFSPNAFLASQLNGFKAALQAD